MIQKSEARKILLERRRKISPQRRVEASLALFKDLKDWGTILSFSSIGSEIDLTALNEYLKSKGRLYLVPYQAELSYELPSSQIDCILVPGVGFDREHFRIGYGKGFYDRLLARYKSLFTIGVGFKEQLFEELLPRDPWDIAVQKLKLF